jgi:hypothetical protein
MNARISNLKAQVAFILPAFIPGGSAARLWMRTCGRGAQAFLKASRMMDGAS